MIIEFIAQCTRIFHPPGTERLLRLFYHPDRRQHDSIETIIPYNGDQKIHINTASFIEWFIFFKGSYEPDVAKLIKRNLTEGGVFVDIGANIGVHTLIAAKCVGQSGKVIAVEPVPFIAKRLRENLALNDIQNTEVAEIAISDKEGTADLYLPNQAMGNMGTSSVFKERTGENAKIIVQTKSLDALLLDVSRVDLLKIDVEGGDALVLSGAKEFFKRFHPRIIIEAEDRASLDFLREHGYRITSIGIDEYFAE